MSMDYEQVARLAQKYIENRPVVVLGCGSSMHYGLPSMANLSEELLDRIKLDDAKWARFKAKLEDTKDLEASLNDTELSESVLKHIVEEAWRIITKKDIEIYDRLIEDSTKLSPQQP